VVVAVTEPSAYDAVVNPTAYARWRAAYAALLPIRDCGCPVLGVGICHSTYKSGQAYLDHKGAPRKSPAMAKPPADILAALSASIRAQAAADEADGADEEE